MPWRFYTYMITNVLKQFVVTASILVVVIAFGAAVKPLSSGSLLNAFDTLKYLLLAIVPMLQFALPFAGAFAVTICVHRMAQDNEFIAMSVSGQSYARLLAPIIVFGLVLTIVVAILVQSIIPIFIGKMASAVAKDLPRMLAAKIQQHAPFVEDNLVIWAEDILLSPKGDDDLMYLQHVAYAKLGNNGRVEMYLTASGAYVDVIRVDDRTSMTVQAENVTQWEQAQDLGGTLRSTQETRLTDAIELPSITNQSSAALTRDELIDLKSNPSDYSAVSEEAMRLQSNLILLTFLDSIQKQFGSNNSMKCSSKVSKRTLQIEASGLKGSEFIPPITVIETPEIGETRVYKPSAASIVIVQLENGEVDAITLQMTDVIVGVGKVNENEQETLSFSELHIEGVEIPPFVELNVSELLAIADSSDNAKIQRASKNVRKVIESMHYHISGRIWQRWAVSVLPLLVIILGSILAIRFLQHMPLSVYARVFVPAVIALLLIFSGGQMIRDAKEFLGLSVMWVGNVGLVLMIWFHWSRLKQT
jgi:lipopolysaccharide export system permease protein